MNEQAAAVPTLLKGVYKIVKGETAIPTVPGAAPVIRGRFPNTFPGCISKFQATAYDVEIGRRCHIGVVLCGGPAPGLTYFFGGIRAYQRQWNSSSKLFAIRGGPKGLMERNYVEVTDDILRSMQTRFGVSDIGTGRGKINKNDMPHIKEFCDELKLAGLVIVGGFDNQTDAAYLADYLVSVNSQTTVATIPKRAEGVREFGVELGFGFDSVVKIYSQLVGNVAADAVSAKSSYHFIRVMGERATHIALEVALQTHVNHCVLSEEVSDKGHTLGDVVNQICDVICDRAKLNKNYGVILIPEGLVHAATDVKVLLDETNDVVRTGQQFDPDALGERSKATFNSLPEWTRLQLLSERDPHGRLRMAGIQTERLVGSMCEAELKHRRTIGTYFGKFTFNSHFYGYETRCAPASEFDKSISLALGQVVTALCEQKHTGMMANITNLTAPVDKWKAYGIPLTSIMEVDRKGNPVVRSSRVDLRGYSFALLNLYRRQWALGDPVIGPAGPLSDCLSITLQLEALENRHANSSLLTHERNAELKALVEKQLTEPSTFLTQRLQYRPKLPAVLKGAFQLVPLTATTALNEQLQTIFPKLQAISRNSGVIMPNNGEEAINVGTTLNMGILLSGGPAPGGHNVISGLFDFLHSRNSCSKLYGFKDGPAGFINSEAVEVTKELVDPFRNQGGFHMIGTSRTKIETPEQFAASLKTAKRYHLDGLVIAGGDDSNTNAALLAEYFAQQGEKCKVIGIPKTIDADLRSDDVEMSFGFDTTTKMYSTIIANIAADAQSNKSVYHFIKMMGRSASHITLECAIQTHPNYTVISEEVEAKKMSLVQIVDEIVEVVLIRARKDKNFGVFLIPEGLVEFTVDMKGLIVELNDLLGGKDSMTSSEVGPQLKAESKKMFEILPDWLQSQLLAERDPHGNVRVSQIESERMVAALVQQKLEGIAEYNEKHQFRYWTSFLGYQARCSLTSQFDCDYCYTLGYMAGALVEKQQTGVIAAIRNLCAPVDQWVLKSLPLTNLMHTERRKGVDKPVIKKLLVDLDSPVFVKGFAENREKWKTEDSFPTPGKIQDWQATSPALTATLTLQDKGTGVLPTRGE